MRVAVFGAGGRTGRHVVGQAIQLGHAVAALVRDPSSLDAVDLIARSLAGDTRAVRPEELGEVRSLTDAGQLALARRLEAGRLAADLLGRMKTDLKIDQRMAWRLISSVMEVRVAGSGGLERIDDEILRGGARTTRQDLEGFLERVARDGRQARRELLCANLPLVVSIAKGHEGHGLALLDLVAAGTLGLIRAVDEVGDSGAPDFMKLASWHVRRAIARAIADEARGSPWLSEETLDVVPGDARDGGQVERVVAGADGVISVVALMSGDREFEHSEATRTIVETTWRTGLRRIVVTASTDVLVHGEVTGERAPFAREHQRNREMLVESGLDWTIGAAERVTDDPPAGSYEAVVGARATGDWIGAADLATFTLDALERDEWIGHVVGVSAPAG